MPIYDYVCSSCGHRAEILHGVHDDRPRTCEACGGQMRKAFAPPAIVFKGTGWAKVERRSTGRSKASTEGEGASTGDGGSGTDTSGSDGGSGRTDGPGASSGTAAGGTGASGGPTTAS